MVRTAKYPAPHVVCSSLLLRVPNSNMSVMECRRAYPKEPKRTIGKMHVRTLSCEDNEGQGRI